jgi:hypothetical protein
MEQKNPISTLLARHPLLIAVGSIAVWFLISCIAFKRLDPYGDMLEAYAFTPHYELGTFKHPPLSGWVARMWFTLLPKTIISFHFLCVLCSLISALGVYALAKEYLPKEKIAIAMLALTLTLPYTTLAFKFNANSILLPIWPWIVVAFKRSLRSEKWVYPLGLGVLAALGMMGKYYTATLLVGIFLAAFCTAEGRRWLKTVRPWVALLAFALAMTPHLLWMVHTGAPTITYVQKHHVSTIDWKHIFIFYLSPYLYGALGLLIILYATRRGERKAALAKIVSFNARDELFWIGNAPILITIVFALLKIKPTLHWAVPLLYIYPIYWCGTVNRLSGELKSRVISSVPLIWLVFVLLSVVFAAAQAWRGSECYYRDDRAAATAIVQLHDSRFAGSPLAWVGGAWPDAAIIPFYTNSHIAAFPGTPDSSPVTRMEPVRWLDRDGVLLCQQSDSGCAQTAANWLTRHGMPLQKDLVCVHPVGFWFPLRVNTCYAVYWYHPRRPQPTAAPLHDTVNPVI